MMDFIPLAALILVATGLIMIVRTGFSLTKTLLYFVLASGIFISGLYLLYISIL